MTDNGDKFDDIISEAAREYNRAPETPRAEMWERIQAARSMRAATPAAQPDIAPLARTDIIPIHASRRRPLWWAAGLAATLLLGVAIGRISNSGGGSPTDSAGTLRPVAQAPVQAPGSVTVTPRGTIDPAPNGSPRSGTSAPAGSGTTRIAQSEPNDSRGASEATIRTTQKELIERRAERREAQAALPYRLAATEHLAMTEALLVSLRADMKSGRRDSTVATWATTLLGTTRMLIDSPASKDIQMKRLLEDLELVLAQIARLPAASGDSTDLELIDRAVKQRQVLTRLRAIGPRT